MVLSEKLAMVQVIVLKVESSLDQMWNLTATHLKIHSVHLSYNCKTKQHLHFWDLKVKCLQPFAVLN